MPSNYTAKKANRAHGNLTPEKRIKFLEALTTGISLAGAARSVGVSHATIYEKKKVDEAFSKAIDAARNAGSDRMEDQLLSLGVKDKNVTALIFLLKGRRPDIYRERFQQDLINSDGSLSGLFAEAMLSGDKPTNGEAKQTH